MREEWELYFSEEASLALIHFAGKTTGKDMLAAARALHRQAGWSEAANVIWDCRAVNSLVILPTDIAPVISTRKDMGPGKDCMVVHREIDEMIARLSAKLLRQLGRQAEVFHTLEEALTDLGLDRLPADLLNEPVVREERHASEDRHR